MEFLVCYLTSSTQRLLSVKLYFANDEAVHYDVNFVTPHVWLITAVIKYHGGIQEYARRSLARAAHTIEKGARRVNELKAVGESVTRRLLQRRKPLFARCGHPASRYTEGC